MIFHHGFILRFIELAHDINANMPKYVVERIQSELIRKQKKTIHRSKILILGISYKRDVADTRESPAFEVIEQLVEHGAKVSYHDPFVPHIEFESIKLKSKPLNKTTVSAHDMAVIITDHSSVDYGLLVKQAKLILDTRNCIKNVQSDHIVKL